MVSPSWTRTSRSGAPSTPTPVLNAPSKNPGIKRRRTGVSVSRRTRACTDRPPVSLTVRDSSPRNQLGQSEISKLCSGQGWSWLQVQLDPGPTPHTHLLSFPPSRCPRASHSCARPTAHWRQLLASHLAALPPKRAASPLIFNSENLRERLSCPKPVAGMGGWPVAGTGSSWAEKG